MRTDADHCAVGRPPLPAVPPFFPVYLTARPQSRDMITVRGTSHIASGDLAAIRERIADEDPDVVAVELDPARLQALLGGQQGGSVRNPFLLLLKALQDWLGSRTGVAPGSDMLAAFRAAEAHGIDVALIDQDIAVTLQRFRGVPLLEKVKFVGFLLLSPLLMETPDVDLETVPDEALVADLLVRLHISFPEMYRVLVEERNRVMAQRLWALDQEYGDVLAFVGAGHVEGIRELLDLPD